MEVLKIDYNKETTEHIYYLKTFKRIVHLWIHSEHYNKLSENSIFDIVKVIHNATVDINTFEVGECLMDFDNKNIRVCLCIDEKNILNIDRIEVLTDDEADLYIEENEKENELENASLN